MKRILIITVIAAVAALNLNYSGGSPGGRTGSPFDATTCAVGCHVGTPRLVTDWITTDIPTAGIVAGQTYTITLAASDVTANTFGFELQAESTSNGGEGTFVLTDATNTQLTGTGTVTHSLVGTQGVNNTKTWSVDWTAPSSVPADITFYAAVNAANGDNATSGDIIYTTKTQVNIAPVGIDVNANSSLSFYPNPSKGQLNFSQEVSNVRLYDLSGKEIFQANNTKELNLDNLVKGVYFLSFSNDQEDLVEKLIIE